MRSGRFAQVWPQGTGLFRPCVPCILPHNRRIGIFAGTRGVFMRIRTLLLLGICHAGPASASTIDVILAAKRAATGGDAWNGKAAMKLIWHYEGQGLKGTTDT